MGHKPLAIEKASSSKRRLQIQKSTHNTAAPMQNCTFHSRREEKFRRTYLTVNRSPKHRYLEQWQVMILEWKVCYFLVVFQVLVPSKLCKEASTKQAGTSWEQSATKGKYKHWNGKQYSLVLYGLLIPISAGLISVFIFLIPISMASWHTYTSSYCHVSHVCTLFHIILSKIGCRYCLLSCSKDISFILSEGVWIHLYQEL